MVLGVMLADFSNNLTALNSVSDLNFGVIYMFGFERKIAALGLDHYAVVAAINYLDFGDLTIHQRLNLCAKRQNIRRLRVAFRRVVRGAWILLAKVTPNLIKHKGRLCKFHVAGFVGGLVVGI